MFAWEVKAVVSVMATAVDLCRASRMVGGSFVERPRG